VAAVAAVVVAAVALLTRAPDRAPEPPAYAPRGGPATLNSSDSAQAPLFKFTRYLVDNLAARTYPGDVQFFDGQWRSGDPNCWTCSTGPGAAAAALAGVPGSMSSRYRHLAEQTFDDAITRYVQPDGSFQSAADKSSGAELQTIFFGVELGEAYLQLRGSLGRPRRQQWQQALANAAHYLIRQAGALTFYVNGNINLQITELLYDAWQATGAPDLRKAYDASWTFLLHPGPQHRGFGLHITQPYHRPDGSDGRGYLAESAGSNPGFDADYTQFQSDEAARLYVASRDPRALLLLNLLTNQLLTRRTDAWLLDTSYGSRHPAPHRFIPFTTPGIAVLAWLGRRRDLRRYLPGQFQQVRLTMCGGLTYSSANLYRAVGNEVSVFLVAAEQAGRAAPAAGLASGVMCPNIPPELRAQLIP
jgi:hypothetical protein